VLSLRSSARVLPPPAPSPSADKGPWYEVFRVRLACGLRQRKDCIAQILATIVDTQWTFPRSASQQHEVFRRLLWPAGRAVDFG
jgi:hypothetical protein